MEMLRRMVEKSLRANVGEVNKYLDFIGKATYAVALVAKFHVILKNVGFSGN